MMTKVPIGKQCTAIRILIGAVERGMKMKPSEIRHIKPHYEAAFETLLWFSVNEVEVKEALRRAKEEKNDIGVHRANVGELLSRED